MRFEPSVDWQKKVDEIATDRFVIDSVERNENGEVVLLVTCLKCGAQRTINGVSLRTGHRVVCRECKSERTRQIAQQRNDELKFQRFKARQKKEIERGRSLTQIEMRFCECGSLLPFGKRVCTSCQNENKKRIAKKYARFQETKRRIREGRNADKGITLEKLYKRDDGVCYLCGRACDWSDFQKVNGAFVVGGSYPTIEHVFPLCEGGTHTWDNIKLACFACNTKKGRKLIPPWS